MYTNNFPLDIIDVEVQNQTRMDGWAAGWMGRWVAGLANNITNSAPN